MTQPHWLCRWEGAAFRRVTGVHEHRACPCDPSRAYPARVDSTSNEDRAERRYAEAEDAFLAAIRADRDRIALSVLADKVAAEAKAWNAAAYREYHVSQDARRSALDHLTERTELLANLWSDIAGAFHGQASNRDG